MNGCQGGVGCASAILPTIKNTVITGDEPSLLGRNWLEHLCLDWENTGRIGAGQTPGKP